MGSVSLGGYSPGAGLKGALTAGAGRVSMPNLEQWDPPLSGFTKGLLRLAAYWYVPLTLALASPFGLVGSVIVWAFGIDLVSYADRKLLGGGE